MTLTKKGRAFRNIGQNNRDTYSFQCFISPTFSHLCSEELILYLTSTIVVIGQVKFKHVTLEKFLGDVLAGLSQ